MKIEGAFQQISFTCNGEKFFVHGTPLDVGEAILGFLRGTTSSNELTLLIADKLQKPFPPSTDFVEYVQKIIDVCSAAI